MAVLIDALTRARMTTGLVVLDACYSGALDDYEELHGSMLNQFGKRYIVFSSSGATQTSYSGAFTTAFLEEWRTLSATNACVTPNDLRQAVQAVLEKNPMLSGGVQTVLTLPGGGRERCLQNSGKPSSFVVLAAEAGVRGPVQVEFDGGGWELFKPETERLFARLVPKRTCRVRVNYNGGSGTIVLKEATMAPDVVVLRVSAEAKLELVSESDVAALSDDQVAGIAEVIVAHVGTGTQMPIDYVMLAKSRTEGRSGEAIRRDGMQHFAPTGSVFMPYAHFSPSPPGPVRSSPTRPADVAQVMEYAGAGSSGTSGSAAGMTGGEFGSLGTGGLSSTAGDLSGSSGSSGMRSGAASASAGDRLWVVQEGDTLSKIARRVGVSVQDLQRLNRVEPTRLEIGQVLVLPGGQASTGRRPEKGEGYRGAAEYSSDKPQHDAQGDRRGGSRAAEGRGQDAKPREQQSDTQGRDRTEKR